ncbi:CHASE2 domain-containing sensor protein [Microbacterium testaceum]|uniref:hypothetical protein n=1 Tax=Microbacterium TaxID=33882 RepID=UPI00278151C1|nr:MULTISPECIES: hypothetical protein [Microbacterium]MDQ1113920.1 CHASE2 domain-containing sensor protein [Microbacterium testaceum]MDR6098973.1 CHASE2 domain-containing sensor protein [Microbacterium sp. SORGH_AS_0454]
MTLETIRRGAKSLAPKLIAFLATGLTASGLIAALQWAGLVLGWTWTISPTLATMIVGGLASVAAFIQRDHLLDLAPAQLAGKVAVFVVTSISAVSVVAFAAEIGIDLSGWSPLIGAALTLLATAAGYVKADKVVIDAGTADGGRVPVVTSLSERTRPLTPGDLDEPAHPAAIALLDAPPRASNV